MADDRSDALEAALHDVSNALTSVLGWLELIRSKKVDSVDDALRAVEAQARHGHRIARGALGATTSSGETARIADVIDGVSAAILPELERRGVDLELVPSTPSIGIVPARDALTQILLNLLANAAAHAPTKTAISLEHRVEADVIVWTVTDRGPGVPAEVAGRLFSEQVTTREGGAGVGLKHAHALASASGGALSLEQAPIGARFALRWPVHSRNPASLGGRTIVLYDDDRSILELLRTTLEARGAVVALATSPSEFVEHFGQPACDIVVADLSPIGDGIERFYRMVRDARPECRLVFMSGRVDGPPPVVRDVPWLQKPFELSEFERVVAEGR